MKKAIMLLLLMCLTFLSIACDAPAQRHLRQGDKYSEESKWDKAISEYTQAIKFDPTLTQAYNNRGAAFVEQAEYVRAIEDYTKSLELDSHRVIINYNRSMAYIHNGEYDKAIEDCKVVLDSGLNNAFVLYNLGIAYGKKGDYNEAITYFNKSLEVSTDEAWRQRVQISIKDMRDAIKQTQQ